MSWGLAVKKNVDEKTTQFENSFMKQGYNIHFAKLQGLVYAFPWEKELDAETWVQRMRKEKDLYDNALKDVTDEFLQLLEASSKPERCYLLFLCGGLGSGKTVTSAYLAYDNEIRNPDAETCICAGEDMMNDALGNCKDNSIIINDEDLDITGTGLKTVLSYIKNNLRLIRQRGNKVVLSTKYFSRALIERFKFIEFFLETFGFNPETSENRLILRNKMGDCMGHIILKRNYTDAFFKRFTEMKEKVDQQLQSSGGKKGASNADLTAVATAIKEAMKARGCSISSQKKIIELIDMWDELKDYRTIPDPLKEKVATRVSILLEEDSSAKCESTSESESGKGKRGGMKATPQYKMREKQERPDYIPLIRDNLEKRGTPPYEVRTFDLKCAKEGNADIVRILKEEGSKGSEGSVVNWMRDIQRKYLGYAFEDIYAEELTDLDIPHVKGGGNKDDIDEIIFEDKELKNPREVRSLKCYCNFDIYKAVSEVSDKEKAYAQQHHIPLFCYAYECFTQVLWIIEVFLPPDQSVKQEDPCESRNGISSTAPSLLSPGPEESPGRVGGPGLDSAAAEGDDGQESGGGQLKPQKRKTKKRRRHY